MDKIKCPNCAHEFDVEEALSGKLEAHFKAEYEQKVAEQASKFNAERDKLAEQKEEFEKKKEKENELFKEKLAQRIEKEREAIQKQTNDSFEQQLKAQQAEIEKKKEENRTLRAAEIDLLKRENDLKEQTEELQLAIDKKMLEKQHEIEEKGRAKEREANLLKEKEFQKQLDDQKKLIDEMKRKAEQGSMQMQGEIQELALEELLRTSYPFDEIAEVGKGIRGADCIQTVVNSRQQTCGSIVYESKRTKNFAGDWIDKLKQDQINCKADIAVIVTETMPSDMERFGEKDGVWICGFHEVKSLSFVLREMLLKTQSVKSSEENKGDKMELLYSYLTSNEFVQNIKRIVENYDGMIGQLNSEKKAMYKIWASREKQIWVVQENISTLFGSIKGIAGKELETSSVLELPDTKIDE
ncbi:MAG: Caldesmon [Bacteroidetes bacterium]|nr:MAG: Caldesmon [Bacteroidota bacterium]